MLYVDVLVSNYVTTPVKKVGVIIIIIIIILRAAYTLLVILVKPFTAIIIIVGVDVRTKALSCQS